MGMPYEFVIVDGGSTDGTLDWLAQQRDTVVIAQGSLLGAIKAFTDGALAARGKVVILANDDVEFMDDGIVTALVYLENNPKCGAVAFMDNRDKQPIGKYDVAYMPAQKYSQTVYVPYAQVGMFRRWLGDACNWWRGHDERFAQARTYAGDNMLSSSIWERGYTVDRVEGCRIHDHVAADGLREINGGSPQYATNGHMDSNAYYAVYPQGAVIPDNPTLESQDKRQLRVLYMPIFEPGDRHGVQLAQKRGLLDALAENFIVYQVDYLGAFYGYLEHPGMNHDDLETWLTGQIKLFQPDMILSQFHGADVVTPAMLQRLRYVAPRAPWINWNGDAHDWSLTTPTIAELLYELDLQLVVNPHLLKTYQKLGIPAGYWQIGYEQPAEPLPDMPHYDVLFLGSGYSEARQQLARELLSLKDEGITVGIYGSMWERIGLDVENTTYDFRKSWALMRNAKIVIGDNQYRKERGFVSNRFFETLACGGGILLHQIVDDIDELTGLEAGLDYVAWDTFEDMKDKIQKWLLPENDIERKIVAENGLQVIRPRHSFQTRVKELVQLLPLAKRAIRQRVTVEYLGRRNDEFGVIGVKTGRPYQYKPGEVIVMDELDWQYLHNAQPDLWRMAAIDPTDAIAKAVGG